MKVSRFNTWQTTLKGLHVIQRTVNEDHRGFFSRFFCANEFATLETSMSIAQINHTYTRKVGAVRGLHYQESPHAEIKLVSCVRGEIFDVAVDLRHGSPTFLNWHAEILSAENRKSLLIPEGFAHGFQTLRSDCELMYLHSSAYNPESERALNVSDPKLSISWPKPITDLSVRDANHAFIDHNFQGFMF